MSNICWRYSKTQQAIYDDNDCRIVNFEGCFNISENVNLITAAPQLRTALKVALIILKQYGDKHKNPIAFIEDVLTKAESVLI